MQPSQVRRLQRSLDSAEMVYLRWARRQLAERFKLLAHQVPAVLAAGVVPHRFEVPGEHRYLGSFRGWLQDVYTDGYVSGHEDVQLLRRADTARSFDEQPDDVLTQVAWGSGVTPVLPTSAINWVSNRLAMQGKWNRDLDGQVTAILADSLQRGRTTKQTLAALRSVFADFSRARLENIARTESTSAFNQGRLGAFANTGGYVVACAFVAVLDARTTSTCRSRNGLIMQMDDKRLSDNTPPLHFQCRSVLSPISKLEWAKLEDSDPKATHRAFGYLAKDDDFPPPKNLQQALAGWKDAHPPTPGFGG